jgi:hypothetical protein
MKHIPNGHIVSVLDTPDITASQYEKLVGVDFVEVYADKETMWRFENALKGKQKRILALAMKKREKPREIGVVERHLLLAEVFKMVCVRRKRLDEFRKKFGDTDGYLIR